MATTSQEQKICIVGNTNQGVFCIIGNTKRGSPKKICVIFTVLLVVPSRYEGARQGEYMKKLMIFAFLLVLFVIVTSPTFAEDPSLATNTSTSSYTVPQSYYNSQQTQTSPSPAEVTPAPAEATPAPVETAETPASAEPTPTKPTRSTPVYGSSLSAEVSSLRAEIEALKAENAKKASSESVGYSGGFFIKSDDGKYKLKINGSTGLTYEGAVVEHVQDAHGGKPSLGLKFSGNAFSENLTYKIGVNPLQAATKKVSINIGSELADDEKYETMVVAGPIANGFDVAYTISPMLAIHIQRNYVFNDDAGADFLMDSFGGRYPDAVLDLGFTGAYKKLNYFFAVFQRYGDWYLPNVNNEMGYAARFDFNLLAGDDNKPSIDTALVGNLYHQEDGTQARVIQAAADFKFGYKRFNLGVEGIWRQIDPDQFTLAQSDAVAVAWASYSLVPDKLQFSARFSHTFDDLTDSGTVLDALGAQLNWAVFSSTINPQVRVGDADGDKAGEWEASAQLSYWPLGSSNLALVTQYMFVNDGKSDGTDSVQSHIVEVKAAFGF